MRKFSLLAVAASLFLGFPVQAQQLVQPVGVNNSTAATITNPAPIEISVDGTNLSGATHPLATQLSQSNTAVSSTNPLSVRLSNGSANIAASAPLPTQLSQGNAVISLTNPLFTQISADGTNAVNSTHGLYVNLLQGNAVVSASNPSYVRVSADGTTAVAVGTPLFTRLSNGSSAIAAATPLAVQLSQGNGVLSATNGLYCNILQGNTAVSATNTLPIRISADGTNPVDATHGIYANLLQGNAVNSTSNPIFVSPAGTTLANSTSVNGTVDNTIAVTVSLTAAARHLIIRNTTAATRHLYFALNGTADNTNFDIPANTEETIDLGVSITTLSIKGDNASATSYSILAY